jgi:hypothetical protein
MFKKRSQKRGDRFTCKGDGILDAKVAMRRWRLP